MERGYRAAGKKLKGLSPGMDGVGKADNFRVLEGSTATPVVSEGVVASPGGPGPWLGIKRRT